MSLGLIGGLGPLATVHYYKELVRQTSDELLIVHGDVDRVLRDAERGDRAGLAAYLARLIERLAQGGATVAAISAVTPHISIRELKPISPLPIVSIIDEVNAAIGQRGYKTVALFGTRFVVESGMFGMLEGAEAIVPSQTGEIHDAYLQIIRGDLRGRSTLSRIADELQVDAIILAGTDLSTVFDESNTDFPHIDCVKAHINGILREIK